MHFRNKSGIFQDVCIWNLEPARGQVCDLEFIYEVNHV